MSESSDDEAGLTPEELKVTVQNAALNFLPDKSREKYMKAYENFNKWRIEKGAKTFSETVLLSYFIHLSATKQPSTMWSIFSMLKATIKTLKDVHIERYSKVVSFLKKSALGHKSKKSKTLTASNVEKFINEAPDNNFLAAKVIIIIGINGACRTNELLNLTVDAIENHSETLLLINLPNTKTHIDRSFVVREEYVQLVEKYKSLRPANTKTDRFFLQYHNGKCTRQPMGVNKIGGTPREIATYLKLAEPPLYTGHCFRRTSATLLADSGADLTTLKRHGGWRSSTVAEGYIEDSIENKSKICQRIVEAIHIKTTDPACPGSSNPNTQNKLNFKHTSDLRHNSKESKPETSKECKIGDRLKSILEQQTLDPWSRPGTSKENNVQSMYTNSSSPSESPTFTATIDPAQIENSPAKKETLINSQTQIANINKPNKTFNLTINNCSNCTFNF